MIRMEFLDMCHFQLFSLISLVHILAVKQLKFKVSIIVKKLN